MRRYVPYLGVVAAIAVVVLFVASTSPLEPVYEVAPALLPELSLATTTPPAVELLATASPKEAATAPKPDVLIESASQLRKALVNIICYAPAKSGVHSISGSGVIVSPTGMILTNAHIAQYFLFADRGVSCDIRTGSPATPTYKAGLVYLPARWVEENATLLLQKNPMGTGERDFAVLAITDATQAVPHVVLASATPGVNEPVAIASYGSQELSAEQIRSGFYPTIVLSAVRSIFTFGTKTPDVLAFVGTPAAQEGSSGGGVANSVGELVATITTSKIDGAVAERALSAITASYIQREYAAETGNALQTLLARPGAAAIADFAPQAELLRGILENAIDRK
ncbi:MAG: serine protease [Candidatus Paceibacterota bacterium]